MLRCTPMKSRDDAIDFALQPQHCWQLSSDILLVNYGKLVVVYLYICHAQTDAGFIAAMDGACTPKIANSWSYILVDVCLDVQVYTSNVTAPQHVSFKHLSASSVNQSRLSQNEVTLTGWCHGFSSTNQVPRFSRQLKSNLPGRQSYEFPLVLSISQMWMNVISFNLKNQCIIGVHASGNLQLCQENSSPHFINSGCSNQTCN